MKIEISIYQYNHEHFIQEYLENAHIDVAQSSQTLEQVLEEQAVP